MKEIILTQGKVAIVDDEDFDYLNQFKWCAAYHNNYQYHVRRRNGKRQEWMHRVIMKAPDGLMVDHIDGNGLNNTRKNLRLVTRGENRRNARDYVRIEEYRNALKNRIQ